MMNNETAKGSSILTMITRLHTRNTFANTLNDTASFMTEYAWKKSIMYVAEGKGDVDS